MNSILLASVLFVFFMNNIFCQPTTTNKNSSNGNYYGGLQQEVLHQQTLCCQEIKTQKIYVEKLENNFSQQLRNVQNDTRDTIEQIVTNYTLDMASLKETVLEQTLDMASLMKTVLEQKIRIDTLEEISSNQSLSIKTLTDKINAFSYHKDCASLFKSGYTTSGVYTIDIPSIRHPVRVYCDMQHDGGGWTVFQRRLNGDTSFQQPWSVYKSGFGNVQEEFWLGNDILAAMTGHDEAGHILRIDLTKFSNETGYAEYGNFSIENESDNYRLTVGQYTGTAGDNGHGMSSNNNLLFTTFDRDNDAHHVNCADVYGGGWWYSHGCGYVDLNGVYSHVRMRTASGESSIFWDPFDEFYSLLRTEMKLRPMDFESDK